jgi:nucleoside phosphorylase
MATPQHRAVIITALPIERTAVLEHLRDAGEEPPLRGSVYRKGIFDDRSDPWEVVVAEIGAGNENAAAEAERVIAHYAPQVALFVGVAGAVKDLVHGDVIASTKVYNYEAGKDRKNHFETRPEIALPAYSLLARARHEAGESGWRDRIRPTDKAPELAAPPGARVGPIAAGSKVLASNRTETYKFIRDHYGDAVAVEMEGHGFLLGVRMNHPTQGIVVRSISDRIGDKNPNRDRDWQPIAARHAAAFAFQILAKLTDLDAGQLPLAAKIDEDWQVEHLEDARRTAGPRYSSELTVGTPLHDVFEALCGTDSWFASLRSRGRKLCKAIKRWSESVETTDSRTWGAPFPEHLREAGRAVTGGLHSVGHAFADLIDRKERACPAAVGAAVSAMLPQLRDLHQALRQDLESRHGEGTADSAHFRQFQAEYEVSFPAANVDAAAELITLLEELETWGRSGVGRAAGARGILLAGAFGTGKTHAICDIAHDRARRGLRTVVLFGEHFKSADEPWDRIRQLLGFGPIARDDLLAALDAAGEVLDGPLLLCIDGLNESRPRGYWRDWLSALAAQAARFRNVRLCVSCRSTYEPLVVPAGHGLERVEHLGFAGMENTACREFFEYHGLEPPVAPSFHPEFSNPLFLRLACETLKAAGQRRMPTGWHGINTALKAFVREKNKAFAQEYERNERERVPQRAMDEFMGEVERAKRVYLRWSDANSAVNRAQPVGLMGPSLLDWLVREGLLITDADPDDHGPDSEDVVRVAFERLGEHLFADRLLGNIQRAGLTAAMESGPLAFAFSDGDAVLANRGLVEALSIQLPEHPDFSCELLDALPPDAPRDRVLSATVTALPWRDPGHMTVRTREIALEALTTKEFGHETFDNLLAIACQETAPDALWLHGMLRSQSLRQRDAFLCGYLHDRVGVASAVDRLLRAPFEVEAAQVPEPVLIRWATLLLWFCVAADRRVRDRATKGLVAITEPQPLVWGNLIKRFVPVNDEYVVERCLCAAYGTLLRTRNTAAEQAVAAAVHKAVFVDPLAFQNALIRDHARCIIELAAHDGVLPSGIDLDTVRPPYQSEWPLTIPSEEEVEPYNEARRDYPRLHTSCLHDDFFTYLLSRLQRYEHAVSRNEMGRWVLHQVIEEMGYGGNVLAGYDGYMIYRYGGGRGRPGWAERIGKKYQWIALSRLAARLADHVEPKQRDWEPEIRGIPLVYSRGRDIDPSSLATGRLSDRNGATWWFPKGYDFAAVIQTTDAAWTGSPDDLPASECLLQPLERDDGRNWQLLEGYPTWSSRGDDDDEEFTPHRQIWMHIRGYFVKEKSAERVFKWLSKQHFMNRWMVEGAEFHEGFVGEYPWGILFTMYPDRWHSRGGGDKKSPARLTPVCNSISSSYGEDAFQEGSITIHVPGRVFFEGEWLRWDGLSGFRGKDGKLRFLDPSLIEPGKSALLIDRSHLLDFMRRKKLILLWTVLGEKIRIGGNGGASPRLEFSRAHLLDQEGQLRSSAMICESN